MHTYSAYGLTIQSEFRLPALLPGSGAADVVIRRSDLSEITASLREQRQEYRLSPSEGCLLWDGIATYVVRDGREVLVDPVDGVDDRSVNLGVLSPAFAMLLQQRGFLLLHASAVAIGDAAVAFLGAPRHGKSTTAAAFHREGFPLVVDDIVAVRFDSGAPLIYPAFPQFKLWPDSLQALGHDPEAFQEIEPAYVKRARPISDGFWGTAALPLRCVYVLAWADELQIEPMSVRDAFLQIAYHSYAIQWMHSVSGSGYLTARARLAQEVPLRRLKRSRNLDQLDELVRTVIEDVSSVEIAGDV